MIGFEYYGNVLRFKKGTLDVCIVMKIWFSVRWDGQFTDHGVVMMCAEGGVKSIIIY